MLRGAALVGALVVGGCTKLPEADSPAAQAYARRCGECHRAYAPGSMTWPMWEYQLGRMRLLYAQLGRPWLPTEEDHMIAQYLERHAGGGQ